MPNCVVTIQSLFIALSTDVDIDALAEAANTVMKATSPTPIISADDVAAVRRGLRIAFSLGQRAGHAAQPGQRPADDPREPACDHRAQHGDAEEHAERTETRRRRRRRPTGPGR